jgi:hypothetical protein
LWPLAPNTQGIDETTKGSADADAPNALSPVLFH